MNLSSINADEVREFCWRATHERGPVHSSPHESTSALWTPTPRTLSKTAVVRSRPLGSVTDLPALETPSAHSQRCTLRVASPT